MRRRPWPVAVLARHGRSRGWLRRQPTSDTEQLAGELAEVKADRDHLAGLVKQLATTPATLEAYTINDRQGCLKTLRTVRQRINYARTALKAGKAEARTPQPISTQPAKAWTTPSTRTAHQPPP